MKSGLEGRNNFRVKLLKTAVTSVSMKSGLEGRNNLSMATSTTAAHAPSQ